MKNGNATVIFTIANELTGGSKRTTDFAVYGKPFLHLAAERPGSDPGLLLRQFVLENRPRVLNVAGSRTSKEPKVETR